MKPNRLVLKAMEVGPWPMNTYALVCPETNESVLFDPGADPDALIDMLGDSTPTSILITHSHMDHVNVLDEMRGRLGVPVMAHGGPRGDNLSPPPDRYLSDGDIVEVGNFRLRVYYAPGHIDDQICFALEEDQRVIVGDTIFEGGPGKTWSSTGFQTTMHTLRDVVLPWPDDTICYPGHGPSFRLGDWRASIEAFLDRDHGKFYGDATWDM
jgi:hydroxyacylglutathione hydrolase